MRDWIRFSLHMVRQHRIHPMFTSNDSINTCKLVMKPGVFIVGTPIGNLEDISKRAIDTLQSVDFILAEDTRHTRKLLNRYQIKGNLISCHQFNEAARVQLVLNKVESGASVALVTNAGMPAVSDPGARVVNACYKKGIFVSVIPGPSSVTTAIALCGFSSDRFLFGGFLSRKTGARKRHLAELRFLPYPVVLFESPRRCLQLLDELNEFFGQREIFIARELTKINEECLYGTACSLHDELSGREKHGSLRALRGEFVIVIAPASKSELREFKKKSACKQTWKNREQFA